MKGPGLRIDRDVRRLWECPTCGRRERTAGSVTLRPCDCLPAPGVNMRLIEPAREASPFDHIGHAARKRIEEALRKPCFGPPEPPSEVC